MSLVLLVLFGLVHTSSSVYAPSPYSTHSLIAHSFTCLPTHTPTNPPTHLPTRPLAHPPTRSPTRSLTHPPTHPPIHPPTHSLTHSPIHQPAQPPHPPTHSTTLLAKPLTHTAVHPLSHSPIYPPIPTLTHPPILPLVCPATHTLSLSQKVVISRILQFAVLCLRPLLVVVDEHRYHCFSLLVTRRPG